MPDGKQRDYTVCLLFTPDLKQVLLQRKAKTDFAGRLNGVGGKLEPGETPERCAVREIFEETGLDMAGRLVWAGTLDLAWNCDNHAERNDPSDPACRLYYFTGTIPDGQTPAAPAGGEELVMAGVGTVLRSDPGDPRFAGHGDLQCFLVESLHALGYEAPDAPAGRPAPYVGQELVLAGGMGRRSQGLRDAVVAKTGRKYFYVKTSPGQHEAYWLKFDLEDWSFAGDPNWTYRLYLDRDEYEAATAYRARMDAVSRYFRHAGGGPSPEGLARIHDVLAREGLLEGGT